MGQADTVRLTPVFQRSFLPDESDLTFSAAPGTNDSHVSFDSPFLDAQYNQQELRPS
jgi:hypothetical protein